MPPDKKQKLAIRLL